MFKIEWDKETGGVILSSRVTKDTLGISPRPVWFEELDLLGLDKLGWKYPHCEEPLMWAVNKQYFYRGQLMFEAKGANIYDSPTVVFTQGAEKAITLIPVDMKEMLRRNKDQMFLIESEARDFIRDTFIAYSGINRAHESVKGNREIDYEALAQKVEKRTKTKMAVVKEDCDSFDIVPLDVAKEEGKRVVLSTRIDRFIASFSGGKDSQVVLDLVSRAIPPTDFEVIYSDTGYELPSSLQLYKDVRQFYTERFPGLKFSIARNHESVLNYWNKIGTPSDTHRWCCSVMKTAPLYRALKVEGTNKQTRVLAFEGVRSEESSRRSGYNRIGKGVKHTFVINARPIFDWNTTEVFMYLMAYNLPINSAYRFGKPRVGCIFCPFGSPWDDMIVNKCYPKDLKPFLSAIERIVSDRKIPNAHEYVKERRWKLRASGTNVKNQTIVKLTSSSSCFVAEISYPQKHVTEWIPTIGKFTLSKKGSTCQGEFEYDKKSYSFSVYAQGQKNVFKVEDNNNIRLRFYLRRIVYKSAYCINCEACEIECPTGALSVYPKISINKEKCIHCLKCLDYHQHGCIVADSLVTTMGNIINGTKISPYGTFGIQDAWVDEFFTSIEDFWANNSLGKKQVPSFRAWLRDAEIIDSKAEITPLGKLLSEIREDNPILMWEVIHINLCYNNPLMRWFSSEVNFTNAITRKELETLILDYFNGAFSDTSIKYALQALLQVFKYSPVGTEFEQLVALDSKSTVYSRKPYNDLSPEAIAYSIYKYATNIDADMVRVSDFYKQESIIGVYREFGISKNELLKNLRTLHSDSNRVLTAELNMGLDHITLQKDLTPIKVLEILTK